MNRILKTLVTAVVYCAGMLSVVAGSTVFVSCNKEGVSRFKGNWSFKTSGMAVIAPLSESMQSEEAGRDTLHVDFVTESGQMDIVVQDKHFDKMKVTMNIMGGDMVQFDAVADGETLNVRPFVRSVTFRAKDKIKVNADVSVSGTARRYEDIMIFEFQYEGDCRHLGHDYHISDSQISCVAKLNDF